MCDCFRQFPEVVAIYAYTSEEPGDLLFQAGENIRVTKKDGDWWTGCIGDRTGVFPANYVQPKEGMDAVHEPPSVATPNDSSAQQNVKKPGKMSLITVFIVLHEQMFVTVVSPQGAGGDMYLKMSPPPNKINK